MTSSLATILTFSLIPVVAAAAGAAFTVWREPSRQVQSLVQHLAAGVVFAAAAAELLPDMLADDDGILPITVGAVAGILLMLGLKRLAGGVGASASLIALVGIDVLIDGFVVSLGFITEARQGLLLVVALALELLFLGLTVAQSLDRSRQGAAGIVTTTTAVALLLPLGAAVGSFVFGTATGAILTAFFAFGLVALLYLVTEELLSEAHETPDTPLAVAAFFAGFFVLVILGKATL